MLAPPSSVDLVVRRDLVDNLLEIDLQAKSASELQVFHPRLPIIIMMMTTNLLDKDLVDDDNHNGDDTNLLDKAPGDLSPAEVSCSARENFPPMALLAF